MGNPEPLVAMLIGLGLLIGGGAGLVTIERRRPPPHAPRSVAARLALYFAKGLGSLLCLVLIVLGAVTALLAYETL